MMHSAIIDDALGGHASCAEWSSMMREGVVHDA
jgi:hypothetical protein